MTVSSATKAPQVDENTPSARTRTLPGLQGLVQGVALAAIPILGIGFLLGAHNYLGLTIFQEQWVGLLMTLFFVGAFLTFPARKGGARTNRAPWYDWALAGLGLLPGGYLALNYPTIVMSLGVPSWTRSLLGVLTVLLVAELLRRIVGWSLVIVLAVFLIYGLTAQHFPGFLEGQPVSPERLINYVYVDPSAILGMLALGATFGVAFITFGQVLLHYGAGDTMTDLALLGFGRMRGGSSKAAIAGSSLAGTVTGGAMSNVLLTGTVTIPLMIRSGYRRITAAAIEALASSGGQIMPPVMGIAAFLIAENLGMPYSEVALAALIPAILLYFTLFFTTDLEAGKHGLTGMSRAQLPPARATWARAWVLVPTLGLLIYALFVAGMEPSRGAAMVALLAIPIMLLLPSNRRNILRGLVTLAIDSGRIILDLAAVLIAAGIVVGIVSISGVGFQFAYGALEFAGGNIVILLLVSAVAAIVLGMGMPSVAAYALVAVLLVPALVEGGIEPLSAHMFVFYFSVLSNITPPIGVAVFAAATLAGSAQMRSAFEAMRIGWAFYLIPFLFVLSPGLLLQDEPGRIALVTGFATLGVLLVSIGAVGYLRRRVGPLMRGLFFLAGALLLVPPDFGPGGLAGNAVGAVIGFVLITLAFRPSRVPSSSDRDPLESTRLTHLTPSHGANSLDLPADGAGPTSHPEVAGNLGSRPANEPSSGSTG